MKNNDYNCIVCGSDKFKFLFSKKSDFDESYDLYQCKRCKLQVLLPLPENSELEKYYSKQYFTKRTSRGYDNYFSPEIKNEIERVIGLNLKDLNFLPFENSLENSLTVKKSLDIGCAAGYFVNYLKGRGWQSSGIDVSEDCINFGKVKLHLDLHRGDYLSFEFKDKFNLITLWATIEHLNNPEKVLDKIYNDLDDNGSFYLSTCRSHGMSFMRYFGKNWRYFNFPEHIYYFSIRNIKKLLKQKGFKINRVFTYGSGIGKPGSFKKKIADFMAKNFRMGDMMVISAQKVKK